MIEMLKHLGEAECKNCHLPISLTIGEWSPETWNHHVNGRPECPGGPVAEPALGTIVMDPEVVS